MTHETRVKKLEKKADPKPNPKINVKILHHKDRSPMTPEEIAEAEAEARATGARVIVVRYQDERKMENVN